MHHLSLLPLLAILATAIASAQLLPPLYNPNIAAGGSQARARADSLHREADEVAARAASLRASTELLRSEQIAPAALRSRVDSRTLVIDSLRTELAVATEKRRLVISQRDHLERNLASYRATLVANRQALDSVARLPAGFADELLRVARTGLHIRVAADSSVVATLEEQATALAEESDFVEEQIATTTILLRAGQAERELLTASLAEIDASRSERAQIADELSALAFELDGEHEFLAAGADRELAVAEGYGSVEGRTWAPVRSGEDGERFFGTSGIAALRNVMLSYSPGISAGSIFSELASDFVGPVRLGFGVTLSESGRDSLADSADGQGGASAAAAVQRFLTGGGNVALNAMWIGMYSHSDDASLLAHLLAKISLDIPALGSVLAPEELPVSVDVGFELFSTIATLRGVFHLTLATRTAVAYGTEAFARNLGTAERGSPMVYQQFTAGLRVANLFSVVASGALLPDGVKRPVMITLQAAAR